MAVNKNYSFTLNGIKYENIKGYESSIGKIYISVAGTAQMVRQYLKEKFPITNSSNYFWVKSESYSGGDSIRVYLNNAPEDIFENIRKDLSIFKEGSFDPMNDIYNYSKGAEKTTEGLLVDYGTKYLFVNNKPPYDTNPPAVDWNASPKATSKSTYQKSYNKSSSSSGKKFDNGTMIKECAGWEIYKRDYGKNVLYSAVKKPETPSNKTDWDAIKGEILTETGFAYKFGKFSKYGDSSNVTNLDKLCEILAKYYQPSTATSSSASTSPSKQIQSKEDLDRMIKGLDVLIKMGNKQAEIKKKAYLIIGKKFN